MIRIPPIVSWGFKRAMLHHMTAPGLPLLVEPDDTDDLQAWMAARIERIRQHLLDHRALLFRGFRPLTEQGFLALVKGFEQPTVDYRAGLSPRTRVAGDVYTSTDYPPQLSIPLHNELSYAHTWPLQLWFMCVTPARSGGATPIADSARVLARMDPGVRERFATKGVTYVQNLYPDREPSWQKTFDVESKEGVERYCIANGIAYEWWGDDRLRFWRTCPGIERHPLTGEEVWFNQAHVFHPSRHGVFKDSASNKVDDQPASDATFGDGTQISDDDLGVVRGVLKEETVPVAWQRGDVLLLENMLVAHGRRRFIGERRVLVGMSNPYTRESAIAG